MSKLKSLLSMYAIGSAMAYSNQLEKLENTPPSKIGRGAGYGLGKSNKLPNSSVEKRYELILSNRLTRFDYGDNFLYALNQKSANKKAKKNGWL